MFNMYDLDNSGSLSKNDFKTMLRCCCLLKYDISDFFSVRCVR